MAKNKAMAKEVRHRAYCNTCSKPLGKWGSDDNATDEANRHLKSRPSHSVQIIIQQTEGKLFKPK